jgi:hypothetical protein
MRCAKPDCVGADDLVAKHTKGAILPRTEGVWNVALCATGIYRLNIQCSLPQNR